MTLLAWWQEEHTARKNVSDEVLGGYLSGARCKWPAYDPADVTATPQSLLQKNLVWFVLYRPTQAVLEKGR